MPPSKTDRSLGGKGCGDRRIRFGVSETFALARAAHPEIEFMPPTLFGCTTAVLQVEDGVTMWSFTCWREGEVEKDPELRAGRALKELEGWPEEVSNSGMYRPFSVRVVPCPTLTG